MTKSSKSDGKWSEYQGYMNWEDAKKKCASIGMRLPTIEELESAYKSGVTESWKTDGYNYWSSTPVGDDRAYNLSINYGDSDDRYRGVVNRVRCLR
jgi:formylglycine-generating enzyme required for sulfatase activity